MDGWKIVGLVSPQFDDGTTMDLYAIVYRTPDGMVLHGWKHAANSTAR